MRKNNMRLTFYFFVLLIITTLFPAANSMSQPENILQINQVDVPDQENNFLPDEAAEPNSQANEPLLHAAVLEEQTEAVRSLLKKKADVDQADKKGRTPLLLAIQTGNTDIVQLLLDSGADVNLRGIGLRSTQAVVFQGAAIQTAGGWRPPEKQQLRTTLHSPLFEAVDLGKTEIAHILLRAGTDVSSEDKNIMSRAFANALKTGEKGLVTALREHGTKIAGSSQLQQALRYGITHKMYDLIDLALKGITEEQNYNWYLDQIFFDLFHSWKLEVDRKTAGLFVQYNIVGPGGVPKRNAELMRRAIQTGKIASIEIFLENEVKPGADSLKQAIKQSKYDIAQLLLQNGVELDDLGQDLCKYLSASKKRDELFNFFLENNADVSISCALRLKNPGWVEQLLAKGAEPGPQDVNSLNLIKNAAAKGETKIIQLLLAHGYPVNNPDGMKPDEKTVLCKAMTSRKSSPEIVTLLLKSGADIHHPCVEKDFRELLANSQDELAVLLLKKGIKGDYKKCLSFIHATKPKPKGMTMKEKFLLRDKRREGNTKNTLAEKTMDTELVTLLLQGVSINEKDSRGRTLLVHAAQAGHTDFAKKTIEYGADVDLSDENAVTALMRAAARGDTQTVKLLLDHGARINAVDKRDKMSALLYAVKSGGNIETVKMLVEQGADVHQTGMLGFDAVTIAMVSDQPDIARYLTEQGADRTAYDNLESERLRFMANVGKLFPTPQEQISAKELSLLEYIQFKTMLKMSTGIDNPADWQPNPELSSPEKTWAYYKKMLLQGKLEKALSCHQFRHAETFRKRYQKMGQEKIIEMVETMRELEKVEINGHQAEYQILRERKGKAYSYGVYFIKEFSEWRISNFVSLRLETSVNPM
jgi:ankyrin repeat protein